MIDIPRTKHYAIISETSTSVYHEGDERSRTNPGHGYPAYTETIKSIQYEVCKTLEEVEALVKYYNGKGKTFTVIEATPMAVETKIVVTLK